jgi:hypothetical protein
MNQFRDKIFREFEEKLYRYLNMSLSNFARIFREHGQDPIEELDKVLEQDGPDEVRLLMDVYINGLSILYLETELGRDMTQAEMISNSERLGLRYRANELEHDAFRIPKRYQKWENYTLCFSDFSIKDLKERVSANSSLEIVCGECDKPTVVSMDQVLATKSLDHWQVNSFFKDWVCPHCEVPTDYREYYLDSTLIVDTQFVPEARS